MMIVPGSGNLIGGMGCIVKSCLATSVSEMELKDKAALKMALGSNPKITYGQEKSQSPVTRMAAAQMIRRAFRDAQEYSEEKHYDSKDKDKSKKTRSKAKKTVAPEKNENPRYDYGNENLLLALERTISCHIHCSRADDIYTALRISREFNLKPVLVHAADALLMEKEIQKSDAGLILGPLMLFNPEMPETENGTFEAAAECIKRGIKVSIMSDHPIVPVEYFGVQGALLCRHGVSADEAMKALTLNPAELLGCGDRVGVIEKGHDADIVLYSGHPLAFDSHTVMTVINGEIVYKK